MGKIELGELPCWDAKRIQAQKVANFVAHATSCSWNTDKTLFGKLDQYMEELTHIFVEIAEWWMEGRVLGL